MNKEDLIKSFETRCIDYDEKRIDALFSFMHSTLETNEKFNLTAIKDEETFIEKMILDSSFAMIGNEFDNKSIIDIGTGAGYPGMVMYILNPNMNLTLLDSTKKKIDYLSEYSKENGYKINCVTDRAESFARNNIEKYDYAVARAVAPLNILLELIIPLLKVKGTFIAMKGPGSEEEINQSQKAMKKLGCHLQKIYSDELPNCKETRNLIYIVKDITTNSKYPRDYKDIKERPL